MRHSIPVPSCETPDDRRYRPLPRTACLSASQAQGTSNSMTWRSHASGKAFRLRTRSTGAVTLIDASPAARCSKASFTSRANTAGIKALKPTPLALIVDWFASTTSTMASICARNSRPAREFGSMESGSVPVELVVVLHRLGQHHLAGQALVALLRIVDQRLVGRNDRARRAQHLRQTGGNGGIVIGRRLSSNQ